MSSPGSAISQFPARPAGVLKGEYGATPAAVDQALQARVLEGAEPVRCRPADLLAPELDSVANELRRLADEQDIRLATDEVDDVLTYALFPQPGLKFLKNRDNPAAFEAAPGLRSPVSSEPSPARPVTEPGIPEVYTVKVDGQSFVVEVAEGGQLGRVQRQERAAAPSSTPSAASVEPVTAPLAGTVFRVVVAVGDHVQQGDTVIILEAMKMETEVRAFRAGSVEAVSVAAGDAVAVGDVLLTLS